MHLDADVAANALIFFHATTPRFSGSMMTTARACTALWGSCVLAISNRDRDRAVSS